jgi:hypothetical protein
MGNRDPINSIVTEQWGVRAESRRKNIVGGSTAVTSNVSFGGGIIQEAGKKHRLLVPYIDENGILQEPVFGISSFKGKTIRKWAAELYNLCQYYLSAFVIRSNSPIKKRGKVLYFRNVLFFRNLVFFLFFLFFLFGHVS